MALLVTDLPAPPIALAAALSPLGLVSEPLDDADRDVPACLDAAERDCELRLREAEPLDPPLPRRAPLEGFLV